MAVTKFPSQVNPYSAAVRFRFTATVPYAWIVLISLQGMAVRHKNGIRGKTALELMEEAGHVMEGVTTSGPVKVRGIWVESA